MADAANDGRLARARAEMPLHHEERTLVSSIDINWGGDGLENPVLGADSPLEHLDDG